MASVHQRYHIIEKIDAGGMAEIYRGAAVSLDGFEKQVAIKRILPSICRDEKFVTMFLDEARLSMQLQHANIVQIFDIGKADNTYFVVMELIDGANLRRVMQRSVDRGLHCPVALACYMMAEVAKALAYAHEKRDAAGKSLGIVHRDVSPPNVLLSRQGEIKLTDFGLAKAATHVQSTEAGVIKGKFSYLCPEVVEGKTVDPRADVYSAGIILWELLCGRKLFSGGSDLETIELVRRGNVAKPSTIRSEVPEELDRIVLKALARNPKRRYQSARALEQAVLGYLFSNGLQVGASEVMEFLRGLHEEEQEALDSVDIGALLQGEVEQLERADRLDPTVGQLPLRSAELSEVGAFKLDLEDLLERIESRPLEDLEDGHGAGDLLTLAQRLEVPSTGSFPSLDVGQRPAPRRWLLWGIVAAVALGVAFLWQAGYLPF